MKFGKYLSKRHLDLPEYAQYFLDYKALKKLIKRLAALPATNHSEEARYERLQQSKSTFFFQLERELEKVTTFYTQKEADLEVRLEVLEQKKQAMASGSLGKIVQDSVAYISIYEGLQRFRRDLDRLEQFVELNATGFSKVLKKWDKQSRSQTKELYLSRAIEVQPMFHRDILVRLNDRSNACLLDLESLVQGEKLVFEQHEDTYSAPTQVTDANEDLFNEFTSFACTYDKDNEYQKATMQGWLRELSGKEGLNHITQIFLRSIPTLVSDDALMELWKSGQIIDSIVDEVANRTVLHLCANYTALSSTAAAKSIGGTSKFTKEISRLAIFQAALATKKFNINALDAYGRTALHYAAIHNRRDILDELLHAGVNLNVCDNDNLTALHYSIFHNFLGCIEDLLRAGAQTSGLNSEWQYVPLNFACQHGAYDSVVLLLKMRADDPMVADAEGLFPLHIVARAGYSSIIPLLVGAGAKVNQIDKLNGWTPLMYAASEGYSGAVSALLDAEADINFLDEKGRSAMFYSAWEGHPLCFKMLSTAMGPDAHDISLTGMELVPESNLLEEMDINEFGENNLSRNDDDTIEIPELELPPPIMPLKRYGHNFLDAKKVILQIGDIQVQFDKDRRGLRASRLTLTSSSTHDSVPRNLSLPISAAENVQIFEVDDLNKLSLTFEVMPTFGTRLLAKAVFGSQNFISDDNNECGRYLHKINTTMVDLMLRPVGTLEFKYLVVKPFPGPALDISKYDTYWKSTAQQPLQTLSYVTASSLHGTYRRIVVTLTRDLVPVVMGMDFEISSGVSVATPLFTLSELQNITTVITLEEWWNEQGEPQVNIHVPFPTVTESRDAPVRWPAMNTYVDQILLVVFDHARKGGSRARGLVFSSTNPEICAMLNWKQPNYPVLFCATAMRVDGIYTTANKIKCSETSLGELAVCKSLREASFFASTNNLMGMVAPADILQLVPAVVPAIRAMGLVLIAGDADDRTIDGVDGIQRGNIVEFSRDIGL